MTLDDSVEKASIGLWDPPPTLLFVAAGLLIADSAFADKLLAAGITGI